VADAKTIRLTAVPFRDGFDWKWLDDDGNEYEIEMAGSTDMYVNLDRAPMSIIGSKKRTYIANLSLTVPFRQQGEISE
jgi:hypothetical protein